MTYLKHIITVTLTTSFLLASFVSTLHVHGPTHPEVSGSVNLAVCSCSFHTTPTESDSDSPSDGDHDEDSCLICKFISDLGYYQVADVSIDTTSFVSDYVAHAEGLDQRDIVSMYRGRAPPIEAVV